MIQYSPNNSSLFYTRADGTVVQFGPLDGDKYNQLDITMENQLAAAVENKNSRERYLELLDNAQQAVNTGRQPATIPVKPLMRVVNDDGTEQMVQFSPVLPDLVMPNVAPIVAPSAAQDVTVATYNMVKLIYKKLFPGS